ncbi:MAG: hypothetical protein PVJ34_20470, partial [Anaerolineae bacterium]
MKVYGCTSVSDFLDDRIVYRNLVPLDGRLPSLAELRPALGLDPAVTPRKSEPDYARVIVQLLQRAQALDLPAGRLERLVYVGDTRLNDGTAFANICRAGGWPGLAFVAAERDEPPQVDVVPEEGRQLFLANRWAALAEFETFCRQRAFAIDEATAVIVDLDKTALGARGRNDRVIDGARVAAVRQTVGHLLGDDFDEVAFRRAYDLLNRQEFHPFTGDNQDYLAYICLILGSGLYALEPLVARVRAGGLAGFGAFIAETDAQAAGLPADLRDIHRGIYERVLAGDPTPFKAFRYNEYYATVARMGCGGDDPDPVDLLASKIVVTQEVRAAAQRWRGQGALLFGLSDKPDEASIPSAALAAG